jgi:hypothetical protein
MPDPILYTCPSCRLEVPPITSSELLDGWAYEDVWQCPSCQMVSPGLD